MTARRKANTATDDLTPMATAFFKALTERVERPARRVAIPTGIVNTNELRRVLRALELARGQPDKT
jgi:hypothetical protein